MNKNSHCTGCGAWLPKDYVGRCIRCTVFEAKMTEAAEAVSLANPASPIYWDNGINPLVTKDCAFESEGLPCPLTTAEKADSVNKTPSFMKVAAFFLLALVVATVLVAIGVGLSGVKPY